MFHLDEGQLKKISAWEAEQDAIFAKKQGRDEPYYGAIGGSITYSFTPTSLGVVVTVKHGATEAELDVSNYDEW